MNGPIFISEYRNKIFCYISFSKEKNILSRGWDFLKTTFENFTQPQKKNLARIIQECLEQNVRSCDTCIEAALSYTGGSMLSNMLQFYPQVEDEIQAKDKIDLIKKNLNWFRQDLYNGNIDIKTLMMFHKENERIQRFDGLVLDDQKLGKEIQVCKTDFLILYHMQLKSRGFKTDVY